MSSHSEKRRESLIRALLSREGRKVNVETLRKDFPSWDEFDFYDTVVRVCEDGTALHVRFDGEDYIVPKIAEGPLFEKQEERAARRLRKVLRALSESASHTFCDLATFINQIAVCLPNDKNEDAYFELLAEWQ